MYHICEDDPYTVMYTFFKLYIQHTSDAIADAAEATASAAASASTWFANNVDAASSCVCEWACMHVCAHRLRLPPSMFPSLWLNMCVHVWLSPGCACVHARVMQHACVSLPVHVRVCVCACTRLCDTHIYIAGQIWNLCVWLWMWICVCLCVSVRECTHACYTHVCKYVSVHCTCIDATNAACSAAAAATIASLVCVTASTASKSACALRAAAVSAAICSGVWVHLCVLE